MRRSDLAKAPVRLDDFAAIQDGKLNLKRDDKVVVPAVGHRLAEGHRCPFALHPD